MGKREDEERIARAVEQVRTTEWTASAQDDCDVWRVEPRTTVSTEPYSDTAFAEREAVEAVIEAAPHLYRELRHLVRLLEPVEDTLNVPGLATLNGARTAIAKAEGKQP